jgi:hypothetical protein
MDLKKSKKHESWGQAHRPPCEVLSRFQGVRALLRGQFSGVHAPELRCEQREQQQRRPPVATSGAFSPATIVLRRKRNHRRRLIPCLVAAPAVMKGPENDPPSSNSVDKRRARTHAHALAIQGSPLPNTRWALRSPGTRFRSIRQRQRPPHVASCLNSYPRHLAPAAAVQ